MIGAGPAGYVAAKKAGGAGLSVLLVEGRKLGGVCLNEGCVPSKTLLQAAKTYYHALHGDAFGVEVDGVRFNFEKANAHKTQVMDGMRNGIAGLMKKSKVEVVFGQATLSEGRKVTVDGETHEADYILICTGSSPTRPPIPGVDGENVVDSTGILELEKLLFHLGLILILYFF